MAGERKTAVAVHPTISVRLAPRGLFIQASQPVRDNTLLLLFLVPDGPLGPVHHFVGADNPITAPVQETSEK